MFHRPTRALRTCQWQLGTGVRLLVMAAATACAVGAAIVPRVCLAARGTAAAQESDHPPTPARRPGYLGVSLRDLDTAEASRLHTAGVMIVTVDRDAPAWTAGLRPGDILLELNGLPVEGVEVLRRRLREYGAGTSLTLRIHRGRSDTSYAVTLGDQEAIALSAWSAHVRLAPGSFGAPAFAGEGFAAAAPAPAPPPPTGSAHGVASTLFDALMPDPVYTGLEVSTLTPQLASFFGVHAAGSGLLVTDVRVGSPAAAAGMAAGDVIVSANNQPTGTRGALAHAFRAAKGNAVSLFIMRDHKELTLSLQPGKRKRL